MASIRREVPLAADPATVWAAVRDFGAPHDRLVPGFVVATSVDGDTRVVTFANGAVAREMLVDADDEARRLVYTVVESGLGATHHNASVEVVPAPGGTGSRLTWITDVLPDALAPRIAVLMSQGADAMQRSLGDPTGTPAPGGAPAPAPGAGRAGS